MEPIDWDTALTPSSIIIPIPESIYEGFKKACSDMGGAEVLEVRHFDEVHLVKMNVGTLYDLFTLGAIFQINVECRIAKEKMLSEQRAIIHQNEKGLN